MPASRFLKPSSRIGLVAPASAPLREADLEQGISRLEACGLTIVGRPEINASGYLSAPDSVRIAELNRVLTSDDLDAVFCVRGGYGVLRILPLLDFDAFTHPKLVVGYSDITALQLALAARNGWRSLSAAMVAPDWSSMDSETEKEFWRVCGAGGAGLLAEDLTVQRTGEAAGTLVAGNLSILTALLGTPYLPDLSGTILAVEDVGEPPYRIDGLLARLHLAGVLESLGGLVFGAFTGSDVAPDRPSLSLEEVLGHYAQFVPGPVAGGLNYGHFPNKLSLPIGIRARLSVWEDGGTLHLEEPLRIDAPFG